jgi:hypothetical protein
MPGTAQDPVLETERRLLTRQARKGRTRDRSLADGCERVRADVENREERPTRTYDTDRPVLDVHDSKPPLLELVSAPDKVL